MEDTDVDVVEIKRTSVVPKVSWQAILVLVLGAIIVIYSAVAPGVQDTRRVFSAVMMALWAALWALVLWLLWRDGKGTVAWLLTLVPVALMIVFFVFVILMNIDSQL